MHYFLQFSPHFCWCQQKYFNWNQIYNWFYWEPIFVSLGTTENINLQLVLIDSSPCRKNIYQWEGSHSARRHHGDVRETSVCTSQWHCKYISNETPNTSMEWHQDVSVAHLHDGIEELCKDISKVVTTKYHQYAFTMSQTILKWITQHLGGMFPKHPSGKRLYDVAQER